MAREAITIGTADARGGDPPHVSWAKVNRMTDELYEDVATLQGFQTAAAASASDAADSATEAAASAAALSSVVAGGQWIDATLSPYSADKTGATSARTAIQNALNAAGALGGGTVYLPPGVYKVTQGLSVPSNVHLTGAGASSIIRPYPASGSALTGQTLGGISVFAVIAMTAVTNAKVSRLAIDLETNAVGSNGVQIGGYGASSRSSGCIVEQMTITGYDTHEYMVWNLLADRTTIRDNYIIGKTSATPTEDLPCIEWFGGDNGVITGNTCRHGIEGILITSVSGFSGTSCRDIHIANNTIDACYDGIMIASGLTTGAGGEISRVTVVGNTINGSTNRSVAIGAAASCVLDAIHVIGNTSKNPTNSHYTCEPDASATRTGVTFEGNTAYADAGSPTGFYLNGAKKASVRNNTVRGSCYYGVQVLGGSGCIVAGNDINGVTAQGILVDSSASELTIRSNIILDYGTEGVVVVGACSGLDISYNHFERNSLTSESWAIYAPSVTSTKETGNTLGYTATLDPAIVVNGSTLPVKIVKTLNLAVASSPYNNQTLPDADVVILSGDVGSRVFTGFAGGTAGRRVTIYSLLGPITFNQTDASSSAANRLLNVPSGSGNIVFSGDECITHWLYVGGSVNKWVLEGARGT